MLIVDRALAARVESDDPIRVGLVGAGFSGRHIAHQIVRSFPSMHLAAICNRTVPRAHTAYADAGVQDVQEVGTRDEMEESIRRRRFAVTDDPSLVTDAEGIDVVIEATGTIDYAAGVTLRAIDAGKHIVLGNVELDATLGPALKARADRAGVVYTNSDGDEPGVAMNMIRFVRSIGLEPVVAGNLKGLYDPYRNPETQREFAQRTGQKPKAVASFADGTKLSMELNVLANATGFGVGRRGMFGPELAHVNDGRDFFADKLRDGGLVDFLVGAAPGQGAFVIGHTEDRMTAEYLAYLKMGPGPLYVFYTPFHLPQLEIPLTVARAALFHDATVAPRGEAVCDSVAVAKRDLAAGEALDGLGGFTCYGLLEDYGTSLKTRALPIGLSEGCRLTRPVAKDSVLTYDDVVLSSPGRVCDRLRAEQDARFRVARGWMDKTGATASGDTASGGRSRA